MKKLLVNLLLFVPILGIQAQQENTERWFRPINVSNDEHKDAIVEKDTIRFFKGEWLEVVAKGQGNVLLGKDTLFVDAQKLTNWKDGQSANSYHPLKLKCTASGDSLIKVSHEGKDTVSCMVIIQTRNEKLISEFKVPGVIKLKELKVTLEKTDILRFSPEKKAAVVFEVGKIEGWGVITTPPTPDHIPLPDSSDNELYLIIGGGVLLLLLIGGSAWFFYKRKRRKTNASQDKVITPEGEKDTLENVGSEPENLKPTKEESLEEKVERLERDLENQTRVSNDLKQEKEKLDKTLNLTKDALAKAEAKLDKIRAEEKAKYEKQIQTLQNQLEAQKRNYEDKLNALRNQALQEKEKLQKEIERLNSSINTLRTELNSTRQTLAQTQQALADANAKILSLNESLAKYNSILTDVPFAKDYAKLVGKFLSVANELNASALSMLDLDVDDPYNLMKYLTRYAKTVASIDMPTLTAELKMLEKGNMVLVGSTLATYNKTNSLDELKSSTIQYFFTSYLQKWIDALVVLNESMAGADRLVDGVTNANVKIFESYRTRIQQVCSELGVIVENVHLFDKIGEKIDLSAKLVDIGMATGDIVDMENAVVYLEGSRRPDVKIKVKVQE